MVGGLRPTGEQAAIIDACMAGGNLVIEAGAGTGKTSTLRMAATRMGGRGLYIAFNRAVAGDAKKSFPKHWVSREIPGEDTDQRMPGGS